MAIPTPIVLPFSNHRHRRGNRSTSFRKEGSSANLTMRLPSATACDVVINRSTSRSVIIHFAEARRSRGAKRTRGHLSNDNQIVITLADMAALVYSLMAVAFYPALVWFLTHS